jgi:hypothetical protein
MGESDLDRARKYRSLSMNTLSKSTPERTRWVEHQLCLVESSMASPEARVGAERAVALRERHSQLMGAF